MQGNEREKDVKKERKGGREGGRKEGKRKISTFHFWCSIIRASWCAMSSLGPCGPQTLFLFALNCTDFLVPSLSKSPFHTTFVIIIGLLGFSVCLLACLDLFYFWIVCMLVCLCSFTCIQVPMKVTVVLDPLAGVTVRVLATQCGCWESNPCPADNQGVLSITEQSFQHLTYLFLR